jgi:hypothetical protein
MKKEMTGWRRTSLILLSRSARAPARVAMDRGDHFPFPASPRLLCLMMPVLQLPVVSSLLGNIFSYRHYRQYKMYQQIMELRIPGRLMAFTTSDGLARASGGNKVVHCTFDHGVDSLTAHAPASRRLGNPLRRMPVLDRGLKASNCYIQQMST